MNVDLRKLFVRMLMYLARTSTLVLSVGSVAALSSSAHKDLACCAEQQLVSASCRKSCNSCKGTSNDLDIPYTFRSRGSGSFLEAPIQLSMGKCIDVSSPLKCSKLVCATETQSIANS